MDAGHEFCPPLSFVVPCRVRARLFDERTCDRSEFAGQLHAGDRRDRGLGRDDDHDDHGPYDHIGPDDDVGADRHHHAGHQS